MALPSPLCRRTLTPTSLLLLASLAAACGDDGVTTGTETDAETDTNAATTGSTAVTTTSASTTADASESDTALTTGDPDTTTATTDTDTTTATTDTDTDTGEPSAVFQLTILHNNDGESQLIHAGKGQEDFGGIARFVTKVHQLRDEAVLPDSEARSYGAITLSSGDNSLAGPEFAVGLQKGVPFYDSMALTAIGYDAICLGNHDFDFGPDVLADFITGVTDGAPFISANLDVSGEPALDQLAQDGRIARSVVIQIGQHQVGIVGATTPMLPFISSPRDVIVDADVADAVQAQVDALEAEGINKIILISHLQSLAEDLALAPLLVGVDVMIAGGGDEILAGEGDLLIPGDEELIYGPYPLLAENGVPIVTAKGNYRYIGRLVVDFDDAGELLAIHEDSGMVRVAGGDQADAALASPTVQAEIVDPLVDALADLAANIIGQSEVALDGKKSSVRTKETNQGDLIADALLWQATQLAAAYNAPIPQIALQNGGGIRNDAVVAPGALSELDTFDMVPFPNFVVIVDSVPATQLKELLENAVSKVENVDGRFAQIAGFTFTYDPSKPARLLDGDGKVIQQGERVQSVKLTDDTVLVTNGVVDPQAPPVHVATINFLANGGDQYPFGAAKFTALGVTYQQALFNYIQEALLGLITAKQYPEAGQARITPL